VATAGAMHLLKATTVLMQHCAATANSEVGSKRVEQQWPQMGFFPQGCTTAVAAICEGMQPLPCFGGRGHGPSPAGCRANVQPLHQPQTQIWTSGLRVVLTDL